MKWRKKQTRELCTNLYLSRVSNLFYSYVPADLVSKVFLDRGLDVVMNYIVQCPPTDKDHFLWY